MTAGTAARLWRSSAARVKRRPPSASVPAWTPHAPCPSKTMPRRPRTAATRRLAGDGAVHRDQGRQSGLPAVLPDGRFLRDCSSRTPRSASRALGIVLTKRGKHLGRDIPMCGVPVHRSDEYLHRLIALGHRVAVCEQLEDPAEAKKRGSKSVVRRDVVRLVTPGTLTEDTLLDARRNNYLLAIVRARASSAGEEPLRHRLDRHLDRRVPHRRMRPRRPRRRDRAARARRDHRVRRALQRPGAGALSAHAARGDAADPRRVRRRDRRAAAVRLFRGRHHRRVRRAVAAGAHRRRGLRHLCGAHAARQAAAAVAAGARGGGRDAGDRPGDAQPISN